MYKKQMLFQRIICIAVLAASALTFIYSLGLMTDLYDCLYTTVRGWDTEKQMERTQVPGSRIYYDMQSFNTELTYAAIVLIIVSLILFITCTNSRRRYYIGNFIAVGLSTVTNIGVSAWAFIKIAEYRAQFLQIDFEALRKFSGDGQKSYYTDSPFWFDVGYVVFGILIFVTVLLVVNLILKLILMKAEKSMIGSRKDVAA